MMTAISCGACGSRSAEGHRFCTACGFRIEKSCSACQARVDVWARFCTACGVGFDGAVAQPVDEPVQVTGKPPAAPVGLPGREAVSKTFQDDWFQVVAGSPRLLVIEGEAGMGKSAVLDQAADRLVRPESLVLRATCWPEHEQVANSLWSSILTSWLRAMTDDAGQGLDIRLDRLIEAYAFPAPELTRELVAWLLGFEPHDPELVHMTVAQRVRASHQGIVSAILQAAAEGPVVLMIDDAHRLDAASLEGLRWLIDLASEVDEALHLMIVLSALPGAAPSIASRWLHPSRTLTLAPLERDQAFEAMAWLAERGISADPDIVPDLLVSVAGGNPGVLATGLLLSADAGAYFAWIGSCVECRTNPAEAGVEALGLLMSPLAVDSLMRLQQLLIEGPRRALLGHSAPGALSRDCLSDPQLAGLLDAQAGARAGWLSSTLRRELLAQLAPGLIDMLAAAWTLEREGLDASRAGRLALGLAPWYGAEDDPTSGVFLLQAAARHARTYGDERCARGLLEQAGFLRDALPLGASPSAVSLQCALAEVELALGSCDRARELLEKVGLYPLEGREHLEFLDLEFRVLDRAGQLDRAQASLAGAIALAETVDPARVGNLMGRLAFLKYRMADYGACVQIGLEALERVAEGRDRAFVKSCLGLAFWRSGDLDRALHETREALAIRERCRDVGGWAASYSNLANISLDRGEVDQADAYYRLSLKAYERLGDPYFISLVSVNLGVQLLVRGKLEESEQLFIRNLHVRRQIDDRVGEGIAIFNLGEVALLRGEVSQALEYMSRALEVFEREKADALFPEVYRTTARAHLRAGDLPRARQFLRQSVDFARDQKDAVTLAVAPRIESEILQIEGRLDMAVDRAFQAVEAVQGLDQPLELGRSWARLAEALKANDEPDDAIKFARKARDCFGRVGANLDVQHLQKQFPFELSQRVSFKTSATRPVDPGFSGGS